MTRPFLALESFRIGCFRLLCECAIRSLYARCGPHPGAIAPAAARMLQEVVISPDYFLPKTVQKILLDPPPGRR